jgi:hypothetical protein
MDERVTSADGTLVASLGQVRGYTGSEAFGIGHAAYNQCLVRVHSRADSNPKPGRQASWLRLPRQSREISPSQLSWQANSGLSGLAQDGRGFHKVARRRYGLTTGPAAAPTPTHDMCFVSRIRPFGWREARWYRGLGSFGQNEPKIGGKGGVGSAYLGDRDGARGASALPSAAGQSRRRQERRSRRERPTVRLCCVTVYLFVIFVVDSLSCLDILRGDG